MPEGGPPPTPSKRARARALEEQGIPQGVEFQSALPCVQCFKAALSVASTSIAAHPEHPIDVPTFDYKFPFINSKKCKACEENIIPAMMNGNYMDIISILKAISGMLEQGADRFKDAHKLGIVKATVPDSTQSNSTKSNSTTLVQLGQRFQVLVNIHALTHDDVA
ncbi:hypothetical protein FANTH_1076 [Fusarium anthophilum]|uniref:Uncharacterized protein n=1 Tax=Fusarium anthophilum TaxID=48485 RepID=A0A8H5EBI0_9HYPO|nr:hypothetical protein FANTH_1076 [Fusarium anthophilum]